MFSNSTASDAFRDEIAPSGDLSKIRSLPIINFGAKILHSKTCGCEICRKSKARLKLAEEIYDSTMELYSIIGLTENKSIQYEGKEYNYSFMVQCSVKGNGWCREEL